MKLWLVFIAATCISCEASSERRDLSVLVNPDCPKDFSCHNDNKSVSLVHVVAEGDNDTLHYWWTNIGPPTILLMVADSEVEFTVNWSRLYENDIQHALNATGPVTYFFGTILSKLIEFNDKEDVANMTRVHDQHKRAYDLEKFDWSRSEVSVENDSVSLTLSSNFYNGSQISRRGGVSVRMSVFGLEGREDVMPHLLHSANSSQFDIVLDHVDFNSGFNHSRFAFEVIVMSSEAELEMEENYESPPRPVPIIPASEGVVVHSHRSLDDEYSPGVFHMFYIETSAFHNESAMGGFIQWRPVCFTTPKRDIISDSTGVKYYHGKNFTNVSDVFNSSLLYAFLGKEMDDYFAQGTNLSLGWPEDGYYKSTNYTAFTVLVGYGDHPVDNISYLVFIVISVGLGIPGCLIIVGFVYAVVQRIKKGRDDDLLLG